MDSELNVPHYEKNDFLLTSKPFEWLHNFSDDPLKMLQYLNIMKEKSAEVGVKNFVALYKAYVVSITRSGTNLKISNTTSFTGQELELDCGEWTADDSGVSGEDKIGFPVLACNHPIMPVQRLINIDSGIEKLKIAFRKGKRWREIISDKKTLASSNAIISLADYGIAVNSENSKHLVSYLSDIEHLNYDSITELNSVGRLGWIEDYGFSPYVENLVFDGELSFKHFFESVTQKGNYNKWIELCKDIRKNGLCARIMLAASFSSALVSKCDSLPFFVHLWGGTETGKTVGLMLAASVWANPEMGKFIHTFNSTAVAQELSAGFVNSLPLILDELQIIKDRKDFDNLIYQLTEGVGKVRGQKTGGLQKTNTWKNCFLTTGEMPISNGNSGGGAVNRIIEIDCKDVKLFKDPIAVVDILKKNYGHAGKEFIEFLKVESNVAKMLDLQKKFYKTLSVGNTTEKQAASASLILTADALIDEWIFKDGKTISVSEIEVYLSSKDDVSQNERALGFLYDYVQINEGKFITRRSSGIYGDVELRGEIWGSIEEDYIYIINHQFNKIMSDNGYNSTAFLSWAASKDIIQCDNKNNKTIRKRLGNGTIPRCIALKNVKISTNEELEVDEIPFE